ncbi:MAG: hypothetical protein LBN02_04215 [Oscillospiraceae bacterium]|jgi:membrane-associated phospholipid phosphatase|nr:hypothetical protein [Oscillospiraceae bacterium]
MRIRLKEALTKENILAFCRRYKHFRWALLVAVFIVGYLLIEANVSYEAGQYWVTDTAIDYKIPFVPWFVIFYYSWFPLLGLTGVFLLFTDALAFKRYIWALMIGMTLSMIFCLLVPNGQDLRLTIPPDAYDSYFGRMVENLHAFDDNANVFPSMHVYACVIIVVAWYDCKKARRWYVLAPITALSVMIVLSTLFIRQHAIIDLYAAFAFAVPMYAFVYVFIKRKQNVRAARLETPEIEETEHVESD